jgi:hypothetical protein
MKANKTAMLTLTLLSIVTTACSLENKLVGEWQSTKPESALHLSIAQNGTYNDDFHKGFSYTRDGSTGTAYWRIRDDYRGTFLYLTFGDRNVVPYKGSMTEGVHPHKIIELTSNRFVVESSKGYGMIVDGVYEFQRVKK